MIEAHRCYEDQYLLNRRRNLIMGNLSQSRSPQYKVGLNCKMKVQFVQASPF